MKNTVKLFMFIFTGLMVTSSCTTLMPVTSKNQTLYNTYLVKHKKYNMEQIFSYPSDINFWKVQDSTRYEMIDTLKYHVKYEEL
jgi:hypothetical protein